MTWKTFDSSHGMAEATTAPSPMNTLWMAKPRVRCPSGNRSATKARNGSMETLMEASSTQRAEAAIHSAELEGMSRSISELRMAPTRK